MIPILVFAVLCVVLVALIIYAVTDHDNRVFGNITASLMATVLALVLAVTSVSGAVRDYTTGGELYIVQDGSLPWLFGAVGIVMGIVTALFVTDAVMEFISTDADPDEEGI